MGDENPIKPASFGETSNLYTPGSGNESCGTPMISVGTIERISDPMLFKLSAPGVNGAGVNAVLKLGLANTLNESRERTSD